MSSIHKNLLVAQSQAQVVQILAEVKQYDASWRTSGGKVYREGGRFAQVATPANQTTESPVTQATATLNQLKSNIQESLKQLGDTTCGAVETLLDNPVIDTVKDALATTQDVQSEAIFEDVTDTLLKQDKTLGDRLNDAVDVAIAELQATATSPVSVLKGLAGGMLIPFFAGAILAATQESSNVPAIDIPLRVINTAPNLALGVLGVKLVGDCIAEISDKRKKILAEKDKTALDKMMQQASDLV